jgi:hypothetical protein
MSLVYHGSILLYSALVLYSLNPVIKDTPVMTMIFGRSTPDPWPSSSVELGRRDASGLLNLISVGKTLPSEGVTAEKPPPAFLEI